ncbi:MAG: DegT/DnrJ/EryC1/StrS family aminotransferase [Clostridia bacterium]|nr:DegT/DnrJ/EryC1/StrS family aminotransferase [Clostridia bacterium]
MNKFLSDPRFAGIEPFPSKVLLASPTMHGDEQRWVDEAIQTNWVSTVGANINEVEKQVAAIVGRKHAVALSSGTAALHMAMRLCGEKLYGPSPANRGVLTGHKVFASDMTFDATVNPIAYEGGEAVFIDTELDSWNMDPEALEKAFSIYPDVRLIVIAHLYGTPGKCDEIRAIADKHGALIIEDAAESFGSTYKGIQTGCFGDVSILSGNGNKIITGSSGGFLLTDSKEDANKVRKWSTQAREDAPWYQHEELGYNYRMSNIIAGIIRGQLPYLNEHIAQKKAIYYRYKEGLKDLPVRMNPIPDCTKPNYWLSCLLIDEEAMCPQVRSWKHALYNTEPGKSCPTEILDAIAAFNAEGRPIWKPMHMQPIYRNNVFVTTQGVSRGMSNAYIDEGAVIDNGKMVYGRGLCLPSDNKMTPEQQDAIIQTIKECFE